MRMACELIRLGVAALCLHFADLNIVSGLEPPDGLSATLKKCYLFSFLYHSLFLHMKKVLVTQNMILKNIISLRHIS